MERITHHHLCLLFQMLIKMGLQLLSLFFFMRSESASRRALLLADGRQLAYHRDSQRRYVSIFGRLRFGRPYFYRKGELGAVPLDA